MPSRYIKESITTSETLASISADAERLFWRLVVLADDYGLYDGRPVTILGKGLTAFLGRMKPKDVEGWMDELESVGLIRRYESEGKAFLQLKTFEEHQGQARAKKPKYPQPLASDYICNQMLADDHNVLEVVTPPNTNTNTNTNTEGGVGETANRPDSVAEVFDYYREKVQPNARLIDAARQKIRTRLKTFSVAQLKEGIDRFASDPWRMENNAHEGAAWFFHSDERSEKFLHLVPRTESRTNGKVAAIPGAALPSAEEVAARWDR